MPGNSTIYPECPVSFNGESIATLASIRLTALKDVLSGDVMHAIASSNKTKSPIKLKGKHAFKAQGFLDSAGLGRDVCKFRRKETVFSQGDSAKNVMYIQEGGVKLTVVHETGKEAVLSMLGPGDFLGKGALRASPFAWRLRPRLHLPPCSSLRKTR